MRSWKTIKGYLPELEGEALVRLAFGLECLEIGSFHGRSAVCMATSAKSVLCVDTFQADDSGQTQLKAHTTLKAFKMNIKGYDNISFRVMTSDEFFEQLDSRAEFDLSFVDGFHEYSVVRRDIENSWRHLRMGGTLVLHDYDIGCGVPLAVERTGLLPLDGQVGSLVWKVKR